MKSVPALALGSKIGFKARRLRINECLSRQELADMAGVSLEEVDLFEHNLPVPLDARRKILRELWAKKNKEVIDITSLPCLKSSPDSAPRTRLLCLPLQ
jgi:transcriptional regulator with XRE-family HTH domain